MVLSHLPRDPIDETDGQESQHQAGWGRADLGRTGISRRSPTWVWGIFLVFYFFFLFYFSLAMGWDLRWEKEGDVIWQIGPVLRDRSGTEP